MVAIDAQGLTKKFGGLLAVDHVDLLVNEGEVFGMLGPNGAGKTTIIRMLMCLLATDSGTAKVCGYDINGKASFIRSIAGFMPTAPGYYERLTAFEYLDFFGELYDVPRNKRLKTIKTLLEKLDIWNRRDDRLAHFSTGMRQKINIVRTLVHKPRILFLDEPTAGLDPESVIMIREYLKEIKKTFNVTILLCTHNLHEAEIICDRIAIIKTGRIIKSGTITELKTALFRTRKFRVQVHGNAEKYGELIGEIRGIEEIMAVDDTSIHFAVGDPERLNSLVVKTITNGGGKIHSMQEIESSLEDVYLELVRRKDEKR